jgi:hypothetical protein
MLNGERQPYSYTHGRGRKTKNESKGGKKHKKVGNFSVFKIVRRHSLLRAPTVGSLSPLQQSHAGERSKEREGVAARAGERR